MAETEDRAGRRALAAAIRGRWANAGLEPLRVARAGVAGAAVRVGPRVLGPGNLSVARQSTQRAARKSRQRRKEWTKESDRQGQKEIPPVRDCPPHRRAERDEPVVVYPVSVSGQCLFEREDLP
ncbi:Hypothetical protein NTJ_03404 [Nesidiocoris tenuis]|uniref:Uncharacterized protein n=1 Tax=Nesidiocoris tenuis TaxID=355587 RepID=A0ABN7AE86_9HEMI|nr:Hypothetical protein NTJ_03404 [Nesidiocoris tenuis]